MDLTRENILTAIAGRDSAMNAENKITFLPGNWDFISDEKKIKWLQKEVGLFFAECFLS